MFSIKSSVFSSKIWEHFGISVVEAMSAGLVPVVANEGGQTEFVPKKYQYHTIEQAANIISTALKVPYSERVSISDSVQEFSKLIYIKNFIVKIQLYHLNLCITIILL